MLAQIVADDGNVLNVLIIILIIFFLAAGIWYFIRH